METEMEMLISRTMIMVNKNKLIFMKHIPIVNNKYGWAFKFNHIFSLNKIANSKLGCINRLSDEDIDKFLIVARSVGTFARALDCSSSVKQPR